MARDLDNDSSASLHLPSLATTTLEPAGISQRGKALGALARIEAVRVVQSPSSNDRLVLQIFQTVERSHLPRNQLCHPRSSMELQCSPTLELDKTVASFDALRQVVSATAMAAHENMSKCAYCRMMINYVTWEHRVPATMAVRRLVNREREDARLLELLTTFASELLVHTLCPEAERDGPRCQAQTQLPLVIHAFFLERGQTEARRNGGTG